MTNTHDDEDFDDDLDDDEIAPPGNRREAGISEDLLLYIVRALVDSPDDVDVDVDVDRRGGVLLTVSTGPEDAGKVIGRRGRVIKCIRPIIDAAAARDGVAVRVEVEG